MIIIHLCLCSIINENYSYQDNLLAKYHQKIGHKVIIITSTYSKYDKNGGIIEVPPGIYYWKSGVKVIRVKPRLNQFLNKHLFLFKDVEQIILDESPNYIFTHCLLSINYLCLLDIHRKLPTVRFAFDNHTDSINSNHNVLSKYYKKWVLKPLLCKRLQKLSDNFYGVTPSRCEFLKQEFGIVEKKVKLLMMGADDESLQFSKREILRECVRKEYSIHQNDFLIVTGGKIDRKKNIHKLLSAINEMKLPHVKVLFFGSISDDLKDIINSLISPTIIYLGWIASEDVYKYFYAADLIAFPGLHSVLWEQALATQTPCVFSRLNGFEHVDYNSNCMFFEKNDVSEYQIVIRKLVQDKRYYDILKKNSSSSQSSQFLYSNIAKMVLADAGLN